MAARAIAEPDQEVGLDELRNTDDSAHQRGRDSAETQPCDPPEAHLAAEAKHDPEMRTDIVSAMRTHLKRQQVTVMRV